MITFREKEFSEIQKEFAVRKSLKSVYKVGKAIFRPKGSGLARKTISANSKITEGLATASDVALNPGKAVSGAVKEGIKSPVSAASSAMPVPFTTELYPVTSKIEKKIYKKIGVDKNLDRVSDKFGKSKASAYLEGGVNGILNSLKSF